MVFLIKLLMCPNLIIQNLEFLMKSTKNFLGTNLRNPTILANPLQSQLHASLNLWKVLVHGFLIHVPQIMSLVTFPYFAPFLSQNSPFYYCCKWIRCGISRNWQSFFISFTKFKFCFVHSSLSLQFNLFKPIDSFLKLLYNLYC